MDVPLMQATGTAEREAAVGIAEREAGVAAGRTGGDRGHDTGFRETTTGAER
jgi:hypothetical protein